MVLGDQGKHSSTRYDQLMGLRASLGRMFGLGAPIARTTHDPKLKPASQTAPNPTPKENAVGTLPSPGEWLRRPSAPTESDPRKRKTSTWQSAGAYSDDEETIRVIRVPISRHQRLETQDGGQRVRVKGLYYYLSERENHRLQPEPVILVRDQENPYEEDGRAIVVARLDGRQIGFMSRARAGTYAKYLDDLGPVVVSTSRKASSKLWVHLPPAAEMKALVRKAADVS